MDAGFGWADTDWRWGNGRAHDFDLRDLFGFLDPRRGAGARRGRMFDQGDLKLVVLRLLDEKPRHGYEIIKALEERSGGLYSPSPGAVYPTLQLLEELGYARAVDEGGGRKIYEITDEGRAHVEERGDELAAPWDAVRDDVGEGRRELAQLIRQLAMAMSQVVQAGSEAQVAEAAKVLKDARRALYEILAADDEPPTEEA